MTVIAFIGKPRTGKTLHMTMVACDDYKKGFEIFANYKLGFNHNRVSVNDMLNIPFEDLQRNPKTLCIQEADKVFDSRRSMRNENVLLSSLTGQSGKRNLNIYYDTQFWNRIDQSLRSVTEYVCSCSCYIDSRTKEPLAFEYKMIDMYDMSEKNYIIPASLMSQYYSMYDSYETTKPITKSSTMSDITNQENTMPRKSHKKKKVYY